MSRIAELLGRADPSAVAIVDGDRRLSYGELDALVDQTAAELIDAGLADGDRVALQLGTGVDFVRYYLAASRAGLVAVPVNPAYTAPERDFVLTDSGARLVVTESGVRMIDGQSTVDERAERLAVLLYTSGTSGRPKGAMLTDRALLANLDQLAALEPKTITYADRVFVPIPLFHIFGLTCGLGAALHVGATVVLHDQFSPATTLAAMAQHEVTAVIGVPSMFAAWSSHPDFERGFAAVRFAVSGSSPLSVSVLHRYTRAGVRLFEGYGVTEAAPAITSNWSPSADPKPGSVGRALPGVEIELRDAGGEPVEDGDAGALFVRGENLFSGYWPDGSGGPDADGWFPTTDIAIRDADGDLQLIGRTTDLVIVNGFNVYPAEVEAVFRAIEGIDEVAVLGQPDAVTGETVVAYLVPAPGTELDLDHIRTVAARSLARFKLPTVLTVVAELPHTVTGKVMKWRLSAPTSTLTNRHAVTLITRVGCHLCEVASEVLTRLAGELGFAYAETDVDADADAALLAEYGDHVPVILIDGREHGYWRVEEDRFRRAINR
jgi:long-chain acyl-CoA synthetase